MFSREIERKYGLSREKLQEFYRGIFLKTLNGEADLREVIAPYLKEWGWPKTVDDYLNEWFEYEHVVDEKIIAYIQNLRKQGIGCYVATNQEKYRAEYMFERMDFKNKFDKFYASAHLGAQKPDTEFFKRVIDDLRVKKDEVLFWDDSQGNIDGARQFGIHAEFFESFEKFKDIMKDTYEIQG